VRVVRFEGGDISTGLLRAPIESILDDDVSSMLDRVASTRPTDNPVAAVLLQNDLWERFDALATSKLPRASSVRGAIAHAMRALALPRETIRAIRPNADELATTYKDTLAGLRAASGWVEVASCASPEPAGMHTHHALGERHRVVVRILVAFGGDGASGGGPLPMMDTVSPLTKLLLVESPLAIADDGELVEVPLIVRVEARVTLATKTDPQALGELAFDLFDERRSQLIEANRRDGGLARVDSNALLPEGISVLPELGDRRFPMKATCVTCHDARGARLLVVRDHPNARLCAVAPDAARQAAWSIEQKRADEQFVALRTMFR
jgi:hypothetical protein